MKVEQIMVKLEQLGSEQTKRTFIRHGAQEPLFGVKVGDLKKLVKEVKKDQELAEALYATGNSDAMYLAGLSVNPARMSKELLQAWAVQANWYMLSEYTVGGVAAESYFARELAEVWIQEKEERIVSSGWCTYANYISITADAKLDLQEIRHYLQQVKATIHGERNRVRYCMNSFVIVAGTSVAALYEEALEIADRMGKVEVNMGQTACKVPLATAYMEKMKAAGKLGVKKKTCIC
ncbi:DNA alkylation repair protein [Paenibacillus agricola]|uniref:DNA alkylation repair protein n=1 Tax=Paenibacillus agricola TaxID=2716264 RepID=A0ABX0JAZ2_9BACL|nr:DNA alkylation repair protein [Paenibacillus agricola]NHN32052.1 DNA alkylation repair protein [Paenibacillus agricola]